MKKLLSSLLALSLGLSLTILPASALTLEDAKQLLADNYVDGVPPEILELDSLDAILEALGDPYTFYMTPEQYTAFNQSVNGWTVVGIGATVETAYDNGYRIMSILPDSPALEAGVQPGDILIAADGVPMSPEVDPRIPIVGEEGTPLTITVRRGGQELDFSMVRRAVDIPIVTYEQVGDAGVIECISFGSTTAQSFLNAIRELEDGTSVWVVDLRSNPGGDSGATSLSAGLFTGGRIMLYFRDGSGDYYYRPGIAAATEKPVIVLTSEHSASGSELFAGDIRTYRAGIALGQRTLGKGTAQIVIDDTNSYAMEPGEAMKITAYRFFAPDGATNHILGVLPTLLISPENTETAAMLLTSAKPARAAGCLKLEIADQTFYINAAEAVKQDNKAAFTELLEALPPSAMLYEGSGTLTWTEITPAQLARKQGLSFTARTFSDVAGSSYAREINTLAAYLILDSSAGSFQPASDITRGQFAAMTASALDLPAGKSAKFSDVPAGHPYADDINAMTDLGFLSGRGDGTFGPEDTITVQEAVTVLSSVAAWTSMDGFNLDRTDLMLEELPDFYHWAEWARVPARNLTILEALPDGLTPTANLTREQGAAMLCRLMESIHLIWD